MAGGMIYIIALIRALQIIIHWPLLRTVLPGNVGMVFGTIIPFVMFDVIEAEHFELILTFDPAAHEAMQQNIIG
jgi:hypothetical protein